MCAVSGILRPDAAPVRDDGRQPCASHAPALRGRPPPRPTTRRRRRGGRENPHFPHRPSAVGSRPAPAGASNTAGACESPTAQSTRAPWVRSLPSAARFHVSNPISRAPRGRRRPTHRRRQRRADARRQPGSGLCSSATVPLRRVPCSTAAHEQAMRRCGASLARRGGHGTRKPREPEQAPTLRFPPLRPRATHCSAAAGTSTCPARDRRSKGRRPCRGAARSRPAAVRRPSSMRRRLPSQHGPRALGGVRGGDEKAKPASRPAVGSRGTVALCRRATGKRFCAVGG